MMKDYFMNLLFNRCISLQKNKKQNKKTKDTANVVRIHLYMLQSLTQTTYQNTRFDIYIRAILSPFNYKTNKAKKKQKKHNRNINIIAES